MMTAGDAAVVPVVRDRHCRDRQHCWHLCRDFDRSAKASAAISMITAIIAPLRVEHPDGLKFTRYRCMESFARMRITRTVTVGRSDEMLLGPCCICEEADGVNIICLGRRSPTPGRGWGCTQCKLPADGATAVVCDGCMPQLAAGAGKLRFVCTGYPGSDGRTPVTAFTTPFNHRPDVDHG